MIVTLLAIFAFAVMDRGGLLLDSGGDVANFDGRAVVVESVVDGDTIHIRRADRQRLESRDDRQRVRLWGIDTPETDKPSLGVVGEPFADEATAFTRELVMGKTVTLRLERHQLRDRYGRLLAYIELPDGRVLNEELILAGLATADMRFHHSRMREYELMELEARFAHVGLWAK